MRTFSRTNQFKKDVKRAEKRGEDMAKLEAMLERLIDRSLAGLSQQHLGGNAQAANQSANHFECEIPAA